MSTNQQPYHLIAHPLNVWLAPVSTPFPATNETPNGSWFELGSGGNLDYDDDGVTVSIEQTLAEFRGAASVMPRKFWRTDADMIVKVNVADVSPEQFAKAIDNVAVTTEAQAPGIAGNKAVTIDPGVTVQQFALLARGPSPVGDNLAAQFEIPACVRDGNLELAYKKGGDPAALAFELRAVKLDRSTPVATYRVQTTAPGS